MEHPPMISYDPRPMTSAPLQRPVMAPHFVMGSAYNLSPMPATSGAPYTAHHAFGTFTPFNSPPAPPPSPFKQQYQERPALRIMAPEAEPSRAIPWSKDNRQSYEAQSPNPSIKSESQFSIRSVATIPPAPARIITSNVSLNPQNEITFSTNVDTLMKAIQAKRETEEIVKKAEAEAQVAVTAHSPLAIQEASPIQTQAQVASTTSPEEKPLLVGFRPTEAKPQVHRKRHRCEVPGCHKIFTQKTHLDIHRRAHTGDRPYMCSQPGCGQRFSQLGNLKTHERRHTGERPYECEECGKRFAQRGNVRAHRIVHMQAKPYLCKLEGCNKQFTQLGNLKSHQNKFHAESLKELTDKFMTIADTDNVSPEDRELWEYFATLYKNSNKGIKGRGKDRKVGAVATIARIPVSSPYVVPHTPTPMQPATHHFSPNTSHAQVQPHGLPMPMPNYDAVRAAGVAMSPVARNGGGYEMFGIDDQSGVGPPTADSHVYADEHARQLAFEGRMYV